MFRHAAIVAVLAAGCARLTGADAPRLESIEPAGAYFGQAVDVRLTGAGFQARGVQHLEGGRDVSADFTVRIGDVTLTDVHYERGADGADVLQAHAPADLPAGVHDVTVVDPYGLAGALPGAFTVSDQAPPLVSVSLSAPAQVEMGAPFRAQAQFANAGGVDARIASLEVNGVPAAAAGLTVAAGSTLAVDVPMQLAARGSGDLALRAVLVDGFTGLPLSEATAAAQVLALSPPALAAALDATPASVDVGQDFSVSLTISNTGDADATSVAPSITANGALAAQAVAPQDVPSGESRTWMLPLRGTASAVAQVEVVAAGVDALTGATLGTSAFSAPIAVQTPAHLHVLGTTAPAVVSVGQVFRAELQVENDGEATALAVGDASSPSPLTTWVGATPPQPLAGSARAVFGWTVRADSAGAAQVGASLAGIDANNSAPVSVSAILPVQIQTAAALGLDLVVPAQLSTGQRFAVVETVRNGGEAGATQLALSPPDCGPAAVLRIAPALPAALGGGASAVLSWDFEAVTAGPLDCSAAANGADANSGQAVQAAAAAHGAIEAAAALSAALPVAPSAVSRGQNFTVSMTVTNSGSALARAVSASLSAIPGGGAGLTVLTPPAARDIAGGAAATLTWTCAESGSAAGALGLSASVAGSDGNSGAALVASSPQASTTVQERAALAISVQVPGAVSRGQTFAVVVAVTNTGGATALGVRPATPQVTATGGAAATTASAAVAADIAAGATATFPFTYAENGNAPGGLSFSSSAAGTDVNSGATASATATSTDMPVMTPAALTLADVTVTPSTIDQGQAFSVTATVINTGQAPAASVALALAKTTSGGADAVSADNAGTTTLAGGASLSVTWNFVESGTAPGTVAFAASASAADANSGAALSAQSSAPATVTVQAPAALSAALPVAPAAVSRGENFTVAVTVTNTGGALARSVSASLSAVAGGGAGLTVLRGSAATDIAGGGAATFTWTCIESGSAAGVLRLSASVAATDGNDGGALVTSSPQASTTVQERAALAISLQVPQAVSRGQTFAVVAAVKNTGGATARGVQAATPQVTATGGAAATTASASAPSDIAAGDTATFTFTYVENGAAPGALSFSSSAAGTDANSGAAVSAGATTPDVPVMTPASLTLGALTLVPSLIDQGQAFTLSATVTNTGQAAAAAVTMALTKTPSGGADATTADTPGTAGLAGGASLTFTWNFLESGTAPGSLAFSLAATGADSNSGTPLSAQAAPATLVVQAPATLSATLVAPPTPSIGDTVVVTLTVSNTGQATAVSVQPAPLGLSGTATANVLSNPSPASANVVGGASATFTWTLSVPAAGTLQLTASVTGTDANDSTSLAASASASSTVQAQPEATLISADPFAADGTNFSYLFSYQGMLYAGPNKSGTAAVRMAPDGTGPVPTNWKLEVDTTLLNTARNSAYQPLIILGGTACHTIGALGCAQNSTACGPDNEGGRAVFTSGTVNGVEWYLLTGTSPTGGSRYAYLTNGSFPLAGGNDDLAYVQIAAGQGSSARMMSAARFALNQLFVGLYDGGGSSSGPVLNVLKTMPSLPGYQASAGSDLINLRGVNLPAVGGLGSPPNPGQAALMVDSIRDFNGAIYVANNGGIAHSVGSPTPCTAPGCTNWENSTPSNPNWAAATSVAVDPSVLGALDPSKKAVPSMVAFGGHLFAARNTTEGPQLWSCDPTPAVDSQQCEPSEWSLVAPNTSGDARFTQFNDPQNTAITLLVATASHLYVGFNNANGVRIYRTQTAIASTSSDFTGHQGCTLAQAGCTALGGNGLGAAVTRLFDGHAFTYSAAEWVYLSAGTGSAGPRLYRLAP